VSAPILSVRGLTKRFGGLTAVNNVEFVLPSGELHAIIGPNGAGKTTFFNLVSGFLRPTAGKVLFNGEDITGQPTHRISQLGMARTLQIKSVFNALTVYENVWIAAHSLSKKYLHPFRAAASYRDTADIVSWALDTVGISELSDEVAGNLAYGDVALLEIAIAVAMRPKLLLLDEPVAGMSPEETRRTVRKIKDLSKSINTLLIEHDVEAVFQIAERITVMTQGAILCQGSAREIANDPRVQEAYLGVPVEPKTRSEPPHA
jgi:branched-chain amino acid transport system ATP-binding protein